MDHGRQGNRDGYTMCKHNGHTRLLHRHVYCAFNDVPWESIVGLVVRHTCDNPRCVNPHHLLIGTNKDNTADMVNRNRQAKGIGHGRHKLTSDQVIYIRTHCKPRDPQYSVLLLSKKFNVSTTAIRLARDGTNWSSLC